jgi:glycosyltransferase involved in cell wall biosynthesis
MKIAMVSEHASPLAVLGGVDAGGQNVHVAELATALARRGHEITVYTRRDDPGLAPRIPLCPGVTVEHLDAGPARPLGKDELLPLVPAMAEDLARRVAVDPPAVLHAHFWMSGLAALDAAGDVPVVQTFHALGTVKRRWQGDADTSPTERIKLESRLACAANRLTASCTDELQELVRMGAARSKIDIVPSGVDRTLFTPDGPAAPRGPRRRLLAIGRLVPRKGIEDALRALPDVPDAELVVAGGPDAADLGADPEARRLRSLAEELGVADRVQLLGRVPHEKLPALIRSADVVVCLPWYEPFGIVPLEAMACGTPVLGSAVGGLLDTVVDGVTGLLLPDPEPAAVGAALRQLLDDDAARERLGAAGARRAARYGWARIAASTERVYLRAVMDASGRDRQEGTGPVADARKEYAG